MSEVDIRLECLRISHRHDLEPQRIVDRARIFESYILSGTRETEPKDQGKDLRQQRKATKS